MDVIMPQLGETVAEGTVTRWYKKVGDAVKADDVLFDVETDKVSTEIPAQTEGVLAEILVAEGVTAKVGAKLAVIRERGARAEPPAVSRQPSATIRVTDGAPVAASASASAVKAGAGERLSPVVRRLLAEHTLDSRQVTGTGREGRITREDVIAHIELNAQPPAASRQPSAPGPAAAGSETLTLNSIRRRTAEHMAKSWTTVPHVLQVVEADFSRVDEARRAGGAHWKSKEGYSLTYLPFIAHAVVAALAKFPRLNATFGGDHLALHRRINLGIAVDLNFEGLLVPVVKDAAGRSLPQLARAINDLAARARAGKLRPDDMTEGTYTVTNNGAFGTLITAPIISLPQVAILSTDGIRKRPVVIEGADGDSIVIRPVGMLAQTFDHRAVDGSYSGAFLNHVKALIETTEWEKQLQG
ncbi:MAG TPA: dihydrolipoamide acetyltransferase family protein [Burkholderiales bacterium]|nr:dihydrolipoamide acetyltransferase family protein [Burkholderiales bacterium]